MKEDKKIVSTAHVSYDVELTREDIDDIMVCALEGGITYWADEAEVVGKYLGECASEQIARGGILRIRVIDEDEDSEFQVLDLEKLTNGVRLLIENGDDKYGAFRSWSQPNDMRNVDAEIADWIIQYALFGEVVFG